MNITYNNKTPEDYDCWLATRPVITPSEVNYERKSILGRRGELISTYGTRGNAHISFIIHQKKTSSTVHSINEIIGWLSPISEPDYNRDKCLIMSDDPDYSYEILTSRITAHENKADDYKRIEVDLEIYPFKFRINSATPSAAQYNSPSVFTLTTDECEPDLFLSISGSSGTVTINGYTFTVYPYSGSGSGTPRINVRKKMTYLISGYSRYNAEHMIDGDYEKMRLKNGSNSVAVSSGVICQVLFTREGFVI